MVIVSIATCLAGLAMNYNVYARPRATAILWIIAEHLPMAAYLATTKPFLLLLVTPLAVVAFYAAYRLNRLSHMLSLINILLAYAFAGA